MTNEMMYEITVEGCLDNRWSDWFAGMTITNSGVGQAILSGSLPDQAALHGVLARIRDLNLTLIALRSTEPEIES